MGYTNKASVAESGFEHNPAPTTKRGKIRAKRIQECKEAGMRYQASDYDTEKGSGS